MNRTPFGPAALTPAGRLRLGVLVTSALVMTAALGIVTVWTLANGGGARDLAQPFGGAVLALVAEMLCLDLALRRARRLMASPNA